MVMLRNFFEEIKSWWAGTNEQENRGEVFCWWRVQKAREAFCTLRLPARWPHTESCPAMLSLRGTALGTEQRVNTHGSCPVLACRAGSSAAVCSLGRRLQSMLILKFASCVRVYPTHIFDAASQAKRLHRLPFRHWCHWLIICMLTSHL